MSNIYFGVVEERSSNDPYRVGRCKVRVFGVHTEDKVELPTADLPWAVPIQDVTSASVSGVGTAPVGIVEGTTVCIVFADEYQQMPLILGTIAGVPFQSLTGSNQAYHDEHIPTPYEAEAWEEGMNTEGSELSDVVSSDESLSGAPEATSGDGSTKTPGALRTSDNGKKHLLASEALSSLEEGKNKMTFNTLSIPDDRMIYPYKDSRGLWTIGIGNRYLIDGSLVNARTRLSKGECIKLFEWKLETEFEKVLKQRLKIEVTQSMFDAMISISYNMGVYGFTTSQCFSAVNAGKFSEAAVHITTTIPNNNGSLLERRKRERALFESEGFPGEPRPVTEPYKVADTEVNANQGFRDPNGVYPRQTNRPDTNSLATGRMVDNTIVRKKEVARLQNIEGAGDTSWSQPEIPYGAQYPYNRVTETESGHVMEFDDSPGAERINIYHRTGTFLEIDNNGTQVNRIVGDGYTILDRDGYVSIAGNVNVVVNGNASVKVNNNAQVDVGGDINFNAGGNINMAAGGNILLRPGGTFGVESGSNSFIQGSHVFINSGLSTGLIVPSLTATGAATFDPLTPVSRSGEMNSFYDSPDEGGMSDSFLSSNPSIQNVNQAPLSAASSHNVQYRDAKPGLEIERVNYSDGEISPGMKLSRHLTLGKLAARGESGIPRGVNYGRTADEIVHNAKILCQNALDLVIDEFPNYIITSWWRSEAVNRKYSGSSTSAHLTGSAADFQFSGFNRQQMYEAAIRISEILPAWDQLLLEYNGRSVWIHIAYVEGRNRMQTMTLNSHRTYDNSKFVLLQ